MSVALALALGVFSALVAGLRDQFRDYAQCRNHLGKPVDWWFIIKENGSMRYVYFDSEMAHRASKEHQSPEPTKLHGKYLLNDPATSPLLQTIYRSRPVSEKKQAARFSKGKTVDVRHRDNTVFIAVNDQHSAVGQKSCEKTSKNEDEAVEDVDTYKTSSAKDAFNMNVTSAAGHVKFFTAAQVEYEDSPSTDVNIYSYLIQHSLPQFPNVPWDDSIQAGDVKRRVYRHSLPKDPRQIFSSNALKANSKGQHFMCMSFKDRQTLSKRPAVHERVSVKGAGERLQLAYDASKIGSYLRSGNHHFATILHYLKTTQASVAATNYNPFNLDHAIYHKYLNLYTEWHREHYEEVSSNMPRSNMEQAGSNEGDSVHLCPMWPARIKVMYTKGEIISTGGKKKWHSLRSANQAGMAQCRSWKASEGASGNPGCISSALLKTTALQFPLEALLLMKDGIATLAPYDDIISPLVVPIEDFAQAHREQPKKESMNMALIVQSWVDNLTMPEACRQLLQRRPQSQDEPSLQVNLRITNSAGIWLPEYSKRAEKLGDPHPRKFMKSQNVDHSKWALSYPDGQEGSFPRLFCVSDLNRTFKHILLDSTLDAKKAPHGRGGASICFSGGPLPELMYGLQPSLSSTTENTYYESLSPLYEGFRQEFSTALTYSPKGETVFVLNQSELDRNHSTFAPYPTPFPAAAAKERTPAIPYFQFCSTDNERMTLHGVVSSNRDEIIAKAAVFRDATGETMLIDESPFKVGKHWAYEPADMDRNSTDDRKFSLSLGFWLRLQQSYQRTKDATFSMTLEWYDFFVGLLDKKKRITAPAPKVVRPSGVTLSTQGATAIHGTQEEPSTILTLNRERKPVFLTRRANPVTLPETRQTASAPKSPRRVSNSEGK